MTQLILFQFKKIYSLSNLQIEKDNKADGTRARNSSHDLEELLKEFREDSLGSSKEVIVIAFLM
jgi:hypothetical protein